MQAPTTHHPPPQGISVAVETLLSLRAHAVLLTEVDEVAGEDEREKPNVEGRDQFLNDDKTFQIREKVGLKFPRDLSVNVDH